MSESAIEILEEQLKQLLGESVPDQAVYNINAAMELAGILETRGFTFQLKDMCPKSMTENQLACNISKGRCGIFSRKSPIICCRVHGSR